MAAADLNAIRATVETIALSGFGANVVKQDGNSLISEGGLIIVTESPEADATPLVLTTKPMCQRREIHLFNAWYRSAHLRICRTVEQLVQSTTL